MPDNLDKFGDATIADPTTTTDVYAEMATPVRPSTSIRVAEALEGDIEHGRQLPPAAAQEKRDLNSYHFFLSLHTLHTFYRLFTDLCRFFAKVSRFESMNAILTANDAPDARAERITAIDKRLSLALQ